MPLTASLRPLRCAFLTPYSWDFTFPALDVASEIELVTFEGAALRLPYVANPFKLPLAHNADVVLMSSYFYHWLAKEHPEAVDTVFRRLEDLGRIIVGLDAADEFALSFTPESMERFVLVLKSNGVYRDRDLYNYEVGALFPGGRWTQKVVRRKARYSDEALEKLRVSIPFFLRDTIAVRRHTRESEAQRGIFLDRRMSACEVRARNLADRLLETVVVRAPTRARLLDVHCVTALTHVQRLEALECVRHMSGNKGITRIPRLVAGTGHSDDLPVDARVRLELDAAPHMRRPVGPVRFQLSLARHKIGLAPVGYGELTYRHGEILRAGAALVCQSLAHVETLFPFRDGHNVVFCEPDLRDLSQRVHDLLADSESRHRIARTGRREFVDWQRQWQATLRRGVEIPLREALGISANETSPAG